MLTLEPTPIAEMTTVTDFEVFVMGQRDGFDGAAIDLQLQGDDCYLQGYYSGASLPQRKV